MTEEVLKEMTKGYHQDTSFKPEEWDPNNPTKNQCGNVSLYLHEFFQLPLYKGWVEIPGIGLRRHYWNGSIDATWSQFPYGTELTQQEEATRNDIIQNEWFEERYQTFLKRIYGK